MRVKERATYFSRAGSGLLLSVLVSALHFAAPADAQIRPERISMLSLDSIVGAGRITDALYEDGSLVVITTAPAAVHLFRGGRHKSLLGGGTAMFALKEPVQGAWVDGRLLLYDFQQQSIVSLAPDSGLVASRPLDALLAQEFRTGVKDTLLSVTSFGKDTAILLRLRGSVHDTLVRCARPTSVRLRARGSPSYTVTPPYMPDPVWTTLSDGRIAFWDGQSRALSILDRAGRRAERWPIPPAQYPVTEADREIWLQTAIPQQFLGQRVFEPVREKARRQLRFPSQFPLVLQLEEDPNGGVWMRRTAAGSGEVWTWVNRDGVRAAIRLPPARELLAVGPRTFAVRYRRGSGHDVVEIYRKPQKEVTP